MADHELMRLKAERDQCLSFDIPMLPGIEAQIQRLEQGSKQDGSAQIVHSGILSHDLLK